MDGKGRIIVAVSTGSVRIPAVGKVKLQHAVQTGGHFFRIVRHGDIFKAHIHKDVKQQPIAVVNFKMIDLV